MDGPLATSFPATPAAPGGGGGAAGREGHRWGRLLARALELPVGVVDDPWTGCRGAVMATLDGGADVQVPPAWTTPSAPDPAVEHHEPTPEEVRRYFVRYGALVAALAGTVPSGFPGPDRSS